eukprot:364749-Pyramimonas_sp.AAC.1
MCISVAAALAGDRGVVQVVRRWGGDDPPPTYRRAGGGCVGWAAGAGQAAVRRCSEQLGGVGGPP